jgi:hypothetical protein
LLWGALRPLGRPVEGPDIKGVDVDRDLVVRVDVVEVDLVAVADNAERRPKLLGVEPGAITPAESGGPTINFH